MIGERIKSYLKDRLKKLEDLKNERRWVTSELDGEERWWTTAELGDMACCKQTLEFIDSLQEDSASEELEKVADQYSQGIESNYTNDMFDRGDIYEAVIYGAQWKEHQDSRLYENTKKMWEEIDKQYDDGFATGQKLLREQMLKEAFEVPVVVSKIGEKIPSIAFGMPYSNYKDGDKVKLIIIKED